MSYGYPTKKILWSIYDSLKHPDGYIFFKLVGHANYCWSLHMYVHCTAFNSRANMWKFSSVGVELQLAGRFLTFCWRRCVPQSYDEQIYEVWVRVRKKNCSSCTDVQSSTTSSKPYFWLLLAILRIYSLNGELVLNHFEY